MRVGNGDVSLHVEVTGDGPVLLLVPGFPELPSSWRHQVAHFAARGYRVAALDVRGYGASSSPAEPERYTLRELAGDVAAVIDALSDEPVVLAGHDWGAPIAWHTAIRYPSRVRAVAGLSVPHHRPMDVSLLDVYDQVHPDRFFYMLSFEEPGVAEAAFEADLRGSLKRLYWAVSADGPGLLPDGPRDASFLDLLPDPPDGPLPFLSDTELDACAEAFSRSGMTGPLNRYRALRADVVADADVLGATVDQPSCFLGGAQDSVRHMIPGHDLYADAGAACTDFRGATIIEGAGHWVQQEAPDAVNEALESFLAGL